jgi:hypothetical protein
MLTSTCDSCHKTMSFEDHLAGMTIPSQECGQGWIHISSTAITLSVSAVDDNR